MATFEFTNIVDFNRKLTSISRELRRRANEALEEEADRIIERAKNEFVPILTGRLRDSIQKVSSSLQQGRNIRGQFTNGSDIEVSIIAGGDDISYAHTVHETPSVHDPPSWEGKTVQFTTGGPKFLELPLREAERGMIERIGNKIRF